MRKPKGLYILKPRDFDRIYGEPERREIDRLVEMAGPPQSKESIAENLHLLAEVEVILSGWGAPTLDTEFLAAAPRLAAFFYGAGSVRGFVTDAFWGRGVKLTSAYAANAVPVSEYVVSAILLSLKRFWRYALGIKREAAFIRKLSTPDEVPGAFDSVVGLVSLGMIGRMVAQRLQPFDIKVIAYDPYVGQAEADAASLGVQMVSLESVFSQSDVVSLHTPALPETAGMVTGELIASMRKNATFINTARGIVVREAEMIEVLERRPDLYAVLDVTHPEPPQPDSPLLTLPNTVLTPHIAGSLGPECRRHGQYMIAELKRYIAGEPLQWEITREKAAIMA